MNKALISVQNLSKSFGQKTILSDISFNIEEQQSLVILGQSGTGKSVLFKCLLGILQPDSASIYIKGVKVNGLPEKKRFLVNKDISMVFQGSALFDSYTILDNVTFGIIAHKKISIEEKKSIAIDALTKVGLDSSILSLYPNEISGGMQKRVALARSIATKPKIIFFDEPTSGLDPISSSLINDLITNITKDLGVTSVVITHDVHSAKAIASKILLLNKGKIAWYGGVEELYEPKNPIIKSFINGIPI